MTDLLEITGLNIKTRIGIYEWEQRILQTLLIDIRIKTDFSICKNNLENTIDYDALCRSVTDLVESNAFTLIETVAENIVEYIKSNFKVQQITVKVSKPHAIKNAANVSVTIER